MPSLLTSIFGLGVRKTGKTKRQATGNKSIYNRRLRMEPLEDRNLLSISWYVSPTGSDVSNNGQSLDATFQTIQKAASLATAGDTVYIRAGMYRETVTPANSGTSGATITYMPYNDETVTINGTNLVTGWTNYSGSIYQATMNWSLNSGDGDQIFVDGQMMNYARYPNTSLDVSHPTKATAVSATYTDVAWHTPTVGTYTSPALDGFSDDYWVGATIHFEPGAAYWQETGTVISSTSGAVTFSFIMQVSGAEDQENCKVDFWQLCVVQRRRNLGGSGIVQGFKEELSWLNPH